MKSILSILLSLAAFVATAQNFIPFHDSSKLVFTEFPDADSTYSLAFDSVITVGSNKVFYPYYNVEDEYYTSENCQFWGPPDCRQQIKPIWIGHKIVSDNGNNYWFFNNQGDTLKFNVGTQTGETFLLYEDAIQRFQLFGEGLDTMTVLGMVDSVKIFRILHTDLQGNTINSALNNQPIIVGKNLGLVRFFQTGLFPEVLKPLVLLGNSFPEAGMAKLTNAMIYDHQPGDEIQYQKRFYSHNSPPYDHYNRFIKYVYVARQDTQDSIIYQVTRTEFDMGATNEITTSIYLKYARDGFLAELPYDKIYPGYILSRRQLQMVEYCGLPMWTYSIKPEYLTYCGEENCWGYFDIPGPAPIEEIRYVAGLGLYLEESYIFIPNWDYYRLEKITYFKKNGITCGNEIILGTNSQTTGNLLLSVYPNPASDKLFLKTDLTEKVIVQIMAINGELLMEKKIQPQADAIDISRLKSGFYLIKVIGKSTIAFQKFIKK